MVMARGPMKLERLKGEIALAGGINQTGPTKPILDMLEEAKLIKVADDTVRAVGPFTRMGAGLSPISEIAEQSSRTSAKGNREIGKESETQAQSLPRIPLPLGPRRLAYIQLPEDWNSRELGKLIKLLQIALGDDSEET